MSELYLCMSSSQAAGMSCWGVKYGVGVLSFFVCVSKMGFFWLMLNEVVICGFYLLWKKRVWMVLHQGAVNPSGCNIE